MMAFRILPPHFGSSVYVWGSIISVFLTALTLGYFFGGITADRRPYLASLGSIILLGGLLIPPIPHLQTGLAEWVLMRIDSDRWGSLLFSLLLFAPSTVLLGMVSPMAVRLASREVERIGNVAGRLYALSTAGSIFGTLFTAFYWIDRSPISVITTWIGWALVALGVGLLAAAARARAWGRVPVQERALTFGTLLLLSPTLAQAQDEVLFRRDTAYHRITVEDNGKWRELKFDRSSQSGILRSDPLRSMYAYTDAFHLAMVYQPQAKRVLFIGGGAATGPKQFRAFYPEVHVDVVEIDPVVIDVAQKYFSFKPDARTTVTVRDGRRFLVTTRNRYDAIIVDAYYAESIPFHVTTVEFMRVLKRRLNPGGVAIFNVIGSLSGEDSKLVRSEYRTIKQVFPYCGVFPILQAWEEPDRFSTTTVRNVMLVAADKALSPAEVRRRAAALKNARLPHLQHVAAAFKNQALPTSDVPLLSDDYAPVDRLIPIP
jgi:spermidine synthase